MMIGVLFARTTYQICVPMTDDTTYQDMEKAYSTGNASREDVIEDAAKLDLDMNLINDFITKDAEIEEDDDDELFSIINAKRG